MKNLILLFISSLLLAGCSKFDELNSNPNATEKVTPAMLATAIVLDITRPPNGKAFAVRECLTKGLVWGEDGDNATYNEFGRTSLNYSSLTNIKKMIDLASETDKNAYSGLGLFVKAYRLFYMSMDVGDIPYSEALKGEEGNTTPKYDTQKEVMRQVLADLKTAEESFASATNFSGDPILNGNVQIWRRVTNAFRLKVLLHLSKKENDPDLKVKETFAQIVQSNFLLQNNTQNFQLVFSDKAGQIYPFNRQVHSFTQYPMITKFLIDTLKKFQDYRLFYYANPSVYQTTTTGIPANSYDAYLGTDHTIVFSEAKALWNAKKFCLLNLRYSDYTIGEPLVFIGYPEQNFIIAEAICRGWLAGNAKQYYEEGIKAAMQFVANNTPDNAQYHHDRKITDAYIQTYLTGPYVAFASNSADQIKQILQQKYLMRFMQNPYEAYYEYRRTGYPVWPINPATNLNEIKDKIPTRWMYPLVEYQRNKANIDEAVQRQYNGNDNVNSIMWLIQ